MINSSSDDRLDSGVADGALIGTVGNYWRDTGTQGDVVDAYADSLELVSAEWSEALTRVAASPLDSGASFRRRVPLNFTSAQVTQVSSEYGVEYAIELPDGVVGVGHVCDRVFDPETLLFDGVDFRVEDETLLLGFDPSVAMRPSRVEYEGADWVSYFVLWLCDVGYDDGSVNARSGPEAGFGALSGGGLGGEQATLLKQVSVAGGSRSRLFAAAALATDLPAPLTRQTVAGLWADSDGRVWVVTDAETFRLGVGEEAGVAVGDALRVGVRPGSAWRLTRLDRGVDLEWVNVGPPLLQAPEGGTLTWYLADSDVAVTTEDGRTRVQWDLGGDAGDVQDFWDECFDRGVGDHASLARALDLRDDPPDEDPDADSLPTSISPLGWLCSEVFRGCAYLFQYDTSLWGPRAMSLEDALAFVRKAAGPQVAILPQAFDAEPLEIA